MVDNHSIEWDAEALRTLRLRMGWSRSDLARRLHCSSDEVESWEEGIVQVEAALKGELEILLHQAEACCDEVKIMPVAENECDKNALDQIEFSRVKADLE